MVTCELSFKGKLLKDEKESFLEDASTFISILKRNGQISLSNDVYIFQNDAVKLYAYTPSIRSLLTEYNNKYVNNWLTRLGEGYGLSFSFKVLSDGEEPIYDFSKSTAFILYWGGQSPLRSFNSFESIPLYEFPYTYTDGESYNDINFWEDNYGAIYGTWRRGDIEEERFYSYLSSVDSPLSKQGLEICKKIEKLTGKKCYFYLFNDRNNRVDEKCPCCDGDWKLPEKMFGEFDLLCDDCRIISNTKVGDE
ncbi:DUF2310 family Zn-ribbon-containing protein [Chitinophaga filiformis]|uniref:Zn-ribbon-containing protein n=1 Tax=Chitinophaga filiformis TaxID=104663 RepID=A0ABY4HVM0_CHIFI|nr:DUF2310 family Zn-ribbon-containing protein [Chitinophaga filiformis]UPK67455.1 Zn-ribbon-containing protein [Chitinophaga filiformis]